MSSQGSSDIGAIGAPRATTHSFERLGDASRLGVTVDTTGPLAFLWDRLVARKLAPGAAEQTRRFVEFARAR
jgi:hypothetical protein